ncbi:hypothetical protein D3C75_323160 [compost metagenome]
MSDQKKKLTVEIHAKINGDYVRGTIVGDKYKSDSLLWTGTKKEFTLRDIENAFKEFEELRDLMVGQETINILSR